MLSLCNVFVYLWPALFFFFPLGGGRGVCAVTLPPSSGEAEDCTVSSDDNVDLRLTPLKSDKKQPNKMLSVKYIL